MVQDLASVAASTLSGAAVAGTTALSVVSLSCAGRTSSAGGASWCRSRSAGCAVAAGATNRSKLDVGEDNLGVGGLLLNGGGNTRAGGAGSSGGTRGRSGIVGWVG